MVIVRVIQESLKIVNLRFVLIFFFFKCKFLSVETRIFQGKCDGGKILKWNIHESFTQCVSNNTNLQVYFDMNGIKMKIKIMLAARENFALLPARMGEKPGNLYIKPK